MAKADLSADRLRELLHYDQESGVFTRKVRSGPAQPGDIAGYYEPRQDNILIRVDRRTYPAGELAWLYVYGALPTRIVTYKDGNRRNNAIANLVVLDVGRDAISAETLRELLNYEPQTGVFTWRVRRRRANAGDVAGGDDHGYVTIGINGSHYQAHRLAWLYVHGKWPENEIDHINGVRSDNRIENLRDVTREVNAQNLRRAMTSNMSSGVLGVSWSVVLGRWVAQISVGGRTRPLGSAETIEGAQAIYLKAKRRLHAGCTI